MCFVFIILEGIDGAGGGTQRKALEKYYSGQGKSMLTLKYPYYENPIGKMIKDFLYSDIKLPPEKQFLLFFNQWVLESPRIEAARKSGLVIADRWVTSGMVYQGIQGVPLSDLMEANRIFKLAIPDAFIFLDVSVETAMARDQKGSEGEEGRFEKKREFLENCYLEYIKLMEQKVIAPWYKVDGAKPVAEVTAELVDTIDAIIQRTQ